MSHNDDGDGKKNGDRASLIGLVYPDLDAHRRLLHLVAADARVDGVEFSVSAPVYKGSPAIVSALADADGLRGKIDAYFEHGLIDEAARVGFARAFQVAYTKRHPRSERQDVFVASGNVVVFAFDLLQPMQLPVPREAYDAIAAGPHVSAALARLRSGDGVDKGQLRVVLRVFLDFAFNPRRHLDSQVQAACAEIDCARPYVIEADVGHAVAGYPLMVLDSLARQVGGRAVWLDE